MAPLKIEHRPKPRWGYFSVAASIFASKRIWPWTCLFNSLVGCLRDRSKGDCSGSSYILLAGRLGGRGLCGGNWRLSGTLASELRMGLSDGAGDVAARRRSSATDNLPRKSRISMGVSCMSAPRALVITWRPSAAFNFDISPLESFHRHAAAIPGEARREGDMATVDHTGRVDPDDYATPPVRTLAAGSGAVADGHRRGSIHR